MTFGEESGGTRAEVGYKTGREQARVHQDWAIGTGTEYSERTARGSDKEMNSVPPTKRSTGTTKGRFKGGDQRRRAGEGTT